jgi:hypothetical protein
MTRPNPEHIISTTLHSSCDQLFVSSSPSLRSQENINTLEPFTFFFIAFALRSLLIPGIGLLKLRWR